MKNITTFLTTFSQVFKNYARTGQYITGVWLGMYYGITANVGSTRIAYSYDNGIRKGVQIL